MDNVSLTKSIWQSMELLDRIICFVNILYSRWHSLQFSGPLPITMEYYVGTCKGNFTIVCSNSEIVKQNIEVL